MEWYRVDTDTLNQPRPRQIRGVDVTVYFGPEDMPVGVRGEYIRDREKFVIGFRYDVPDEPTKRVKSDDKVNLILGQTSDRLLEIELDVDALKVDAVRLQLPRVEKILDLLIKNAPKGANRIDNYIAASGAFKQVQPQLESALTR